MIYAEIDRNESFKRLNKTLVDNRFSEVTPYNPLMLALEITTTCNLKCIRCERRSIDPVHLDHHMSRETFERVSVLFPHVRGISIVGGLGEPLLAPDFWEYVQRIKAHGCQVQYFTNATRLTDDAIMKTLEHEVDVVVFSIDSAKPETYEKLKTGGKYTHITNRIDTFAKLRRAHRGKTKIMLNCAIQKDTVEGMIPLLRFASERAVDKIWFTGVITHVQEEVENSHLQLPLHTLKARMSEVAEEARKIGMEIRLPETELRSRQICTDLWTNLYIFYNGDICACPHFREPKTYFFHVSGDRVANEARKLPDTILGNAQEVDPCMLWDGPGHRIMRKRMLEGRPTYPCRECHFSYGLH